MRLLKWLGILVLVLFALVGALTVAGVVVASYGLKELARYEAPMPERALLTLDLADGVVETTAGDPFVLAGIGRQIGLAELVQGLEAAGRDPRVQGLVVRIGSGDLGLARADEIAAAVREFQSHKKFAIAFAESFGEAGDGNAHYLLATAFDQIWLQPSGDLGLTGTMIETPFFRGALEDLGIEPRLDRRREYKGAIDSFISDSMPAPLAENLQRLVDSMTGRIAEAIGERLQLDAAAGRRLIDDGPYLAADALEAKLVDRLGYWDEFEAEAKSLGQDATSYDLVDYARQVSPAADATRIAVIYGIGPIALGDSEQDPLLDQWIMGAKTVAEALREARLDGDVGAIILRVDSPGGSYAASDTIWREVDAARRSGKPVIVSMGDAAASGGYFVAAPASLILADPATITGSIGVFSGKFLLTGLWDQLGIRWDGVQAGANADIGSFNHDYTPEGWAYLQAELDRIYADFTGKVAAGRELSPAAVEAVAKGQVWSGSDAVANGLVDRLGGFRDAIAAAREMLKLPEDAAVALVTYPTETETIAGYLGRFFGSETTGIRAALGELTAALRAIREFSGYARMGSGRPRLEAAPIEPAR